MSDISNRLRQISIPPSENEAFDTWLEGKDAIALLKDNARYEDFVVYASFSMHTFMHAIVVPASKITPPMSKISFHGAAIPLRHGEFPISSRIRRKFR